MNLATPLALLEAPEVTHGLSATPTRHRHQQGQFPCVRSFLHYCFRLPPRRAPPSPPPTRKASRARLPASKPAIRSPSSSRSSTPLQESYRKGSWSPPTRRTSASLPAAASCG